MKVIHHYQQNRTQYLVIQKRFFFFKWTETFHQPTIWRFKWRDEFGDCIYNESMQEWLQQEADKLFK